MTPTSALAAPLTVPEPTPEASGSNWRRAGAADRVLMLLLAEREWDTRYRGR